MSEQSLARAVLAWMDVPLDQDGGTFVELEAMARAALSTPPADDVREALARLIECEYYIADPLDEGMVPAGNALASVIMAEFEVRPHGTVTDAEVDRAAHVFWDAMLRISPREAMRGALEAAREVHP